MTLGTLHSLYISEIKDGAPPVRLRMRSQDFAELQNQVHDPFGICDMTTFRGAKILIDDGALSTRFEHDT